MATYATERELKDELSQLAIDHYGQEVMPSNDEFSGSQPQMDESASPMSDNSSDAKSDAPTFTDDDIPF